MRKTTDSEYWIIHTKYEIIKQDLLDFFSLWLFDPIPGHGLLLRGFTITPIGHTTLCRTALDEWSAPLRDLYLITHNHKRQASMPPARFEPTVPASEGPQQSR